MSAFLLFIIVYLTGFGLGMALVEGLLRGKRNG